MHVFAAGVCLPMPAATSPWLPFVLCAAGAALALCGATGLACWWLGQRER